MIEAQARQAPHRGLLHQKRMPVGLSAVRRGARLGAGGVAAAAVGAAELSVAEPEGGVAGRAATRGVATGGWYWAGSCEVLG